MSANKSRHVAIERAQAGVRSLRSGIQLFTTAISIDANGGRMNDTNRSPKTQLGLDQGSCAC
jgi:hypothetical protein